MNPGTAYYPAAAVPHQPGHGIGIAWAIAIMFAAVAACSFAVDQSVTLSALPNAPIASGAPR